MCVWWVVLSQIETDGETAMSKKRAARDLVLFPQLLKAAVQGGTGNIETGCGKINIATRLL